ncbi:MAG: CRISPR-associated helicase Cas3' [Gallionella sp.]|nr:CRISPR-associated helicase Cas3' [Gallionella sp.]MDP1940485.1 CRISPR-associated helicase Cas3' [Gallionella sp.]
MTPKDVMIAHHRESDGAIQTLEQHLRGVASMSGLYAQKLNLEDQGELIGLLHDLGKYSQVFQSYIKSAVGLLNQDEDEEFVDAAGLKGKIDHSTAGAQLIWQELSKQGQLGQIVGQILSLCIASHHSGLIDCLSSDTNSLGEDIFGRRMNKIPERTHLQEALIKADDSILSRAKALTSKPSMITAMQAALAKIVRFAPIKNDKSTVVQQQFGLLVRFLFSCLIDADRIDSSDFESPKAAKLRAHGQYTEWNVLCKRLEKHLAGLKPAKTIDYLRCDISNHCHTAASRDKGIYTLTVPTGGGKTLASLRFALHHAKTHKMDRVIYVIPFTSIIDQNAEVVRSILEPTGTEPSSVVLEHHSNLTPEEQSWRGKILAENWDAPVIYTTSVQLLETLFGAGTRGARRMHQLANTVLIFDEIQTLPVNCVHLFNNAINFLVEQCGSTVVLCTATQPLLDQVNVEKGALRIPDGNELMHDVKKLFDELKRVEVKNRRKPGGWTNDEVASLAIEETRRTGSCLVIVNTKNSAQTLYSLCKHSDSIPLYHLSTSMCPTHRRSILTEIRERLEKQLPVLCFSTQLIEAGVDVDFGAVIRFTAGLDSIAQAAGRCNRNGLRDIGTVHVVNPQDERIEMLQDICIGRDKAERVLDEYEDNPLQFGNDRIGLEAMKRYYTYYFFDRQREMDYSLTEKNIGHNDTLLNLLSGNSLAVHEHGKRTGQAPNIYLRQSFMSAAKAFKAIDAPTRGVIVQHGKEGQTIVADLCAAYLPDKEFDMLRRAQQFTVNVFPNVLERLTKAGAVQEIQEGTGILYLDYRYYSDEFGLSETPVRNMEAWNA